MLSSRRRLLLVSRFTAGAPPCYQLLALQLCVQFASQVLSLLQEMQHVHLVLQHIGL